MKYLFVIFIFLITTDGSLAAYSPVNAAMVVNAKTGEIIYSYNVDHKTQPASLTKMMTLLLAFKALQQKKILPTTLIRISNNAASQKPCIIGLKSGTFISVRNAILAMITKSANDIAVALAEHIGKDEKTFVRMMNKEAQRLGMYSTRFFNPSGWKDPRQLTTVRDMAKLSRALLMEYPGYYHLFATKQFCFNNKLMKNHNNLLWKKGDIVIDGIKTGFVNASGFNVAASAVKDKTRLIAIILGGKSTNHRDTQANLLLRKGFERVFKKESAVKSNQKEKQINIYQAYCKKKSILSNDRDKDDSKLNAQNSVVSGIYNKILISPENKETQIVK